jgi:multidrug transporter EmrE-like cation transporter
LRLVGARLAAPVQLYGNARIGWLVYGEKLDPLAVLGMALIVAGVVVLNLFSKTAAH